MTQVLPVDIISEVLFRTPLNTLNTCKLVSKEWKELIYDSTFFPFYLKKTGTLFGFFIQDINISKFVGVDETGEACINKSWPSGNFRILASCNHGIVCCEKRMDLNFSWWIGKPATEQWKEMPIPNLHHKTVGVAIIISNSKPLRFKIIRLSEMGINKRMYMKYAFEIFDSRSWNWERKRNYMNLYYEELINIYQSRNVLAFDATEKYFNKFSLPQTQVNAQQIRLVEYQGGLGCICSIPNGNVQVWLTNSCVNYEWRMKMDLDIKFLEEMFTYPNLIGFSNSNTSFFKAFDKVIFFNSKDGAFTSKEIDFRLRHAQQSFQFCSDEECVECLPKKNAWWYCFPYYKMGNSNVLYCFLTLVNHRYFYASSR